MYQIRCDDYILFDPRDENLIVLDPKFNLEVNAVGGGSFTILPTHPYYSKVMKLKSVFELRQNSQVIFRGRMIASNKDFYNRVNVDLEGALAYTNDTIIPPFNFPEDFPEAESAENVVEYFLGWILDQHNVRTASWQKLKLGKVTVSDPNNYITRSSSTYSSTWDTLKSKLFDSALGGYLVVRYESDGNYVDYLSELELTNTQRITFGENMLDITNESDASQTYSAIMPFGAEIENTVENDDGTTETVKSIVTIADLPDGDLTDDLVKDGLYIYSKSAVVQYGWLCVPVDDATWNDVTVASRLQTKATEALLSDGMLLSGSITIKAVDLHFTDDQIQSFRYGRNVVAESTIHGVEAGIYPLTKLDIDVLNPQNTTITIGDTRRTLVDINQQIQADTIVRVESAEKDIVENRTEISATVEQMLILNTEVLNTSREIILGALEEFTETGEFAAFKQTVEAQFKVMADDISMNFKTTTQSIADVNGDLQEKFKEVYKHITFNENGITIGSSENGIVLNIDNDQIVFSKNGTPFGYWDGNDFHTGNIIVEVNERAQFGNFAFIPRSDGSLSFLKVGG